MPLDKDDMVEAMWEVLTDPENPKSDIIQDYCNGFVTMMKSGVVNPHTQKIVSLNSTLFHQLARPNVDFSVWSTYELEQVDLTNYFLGKATISGPKIITVGAVCAADVASSCPPAGGPKGLPFYTALCEYTTENAEVVGTSII